jgi:hypothetical protein
MAIFEDKVKEVKRKRSLEPQFWTAILDPNFGSRFETQILFFWGGGVRVKGEVGIKSIKGGVSM